MKRSYQENRFQNSSYDTIKNDRSTGARGGVAFLIKRGLVINKEYRITDFNIITDNEALVIDIDLSNNQNLTLLGINLTRQTEVFESTLEAALSSGDVPELKSTQDIDKYADFTAISTAVDKAIPTSKSGRPESQPISEETLALIKEKCGLRRQYSQAHDPLVKMHINQLQKEIKDNLRIESQASWEKFCNDISLETNHTESWRKIKNFLKPKDLRNYPALRLDAKTGKTNADKVQLFAEGVERHFGIQSNNFDSNHFDEVNQ